MRALGILILMAFVFTGCNKEKTYPTYPVIYKVFIKDPDRQMERVRVETNTSYPEELFSSKISETKLKTVKATSEYYLHKEDSFIISPSEEVYQGCDASLRVTFKTETDEQVFTIDSVDLNSAESSVIKFRWPEDTNKYKVE